VKSQLTMTLDGFINDYARTTECLPGPHATSNIRLLL